MTAPTTLPTPSTRRLDLDWLRTLTVLLVLPFHALLVFVMNPNSVVYMKDTVNCASCDRIAGFIAVWQMQLLFIIAGISSAYALRKRSGWQYLKERVVRLLIPFTFGLVVFVPLMTYITQVARGRGLTFWQHYAQFWRLGPDLTGISGTFTPAHLWFILFLFAFSVIALPLFLLLKSRFAAGGVRALAWLFEKPLVALFGFGLLISFAGRTEILGAQNPLYYIVVFITGYLLATDDRYQKAIARDWWLALLLALALEVLRQTHLPNTLPGSPARAIREVAMEFNSWAWCFALLGIGRRVFMRGGRLLEYLSEASYPFYIMHLLVLTVVTYGLVRINAAIAVKYTLIVLASYAVTFLLYEVARRISPLRFLLGIKLRRAGTQAEKARVLERQ